MFQSSENDTYTLDNFQGPLEYLVHLIQKKEVDLQDIPIHAIIHQYLERIEKLSKEQVDKSAEFVGTTATLLYLKSKLLIPALSTDETDLPEELDPSFEVIHHLLEYVRIKEAARQLAEREAQGAVFHRGMSEIPEPAKRMGIEHLALPMLEQAFQEAMERAKSREGKIDEEEWRVSDKTRWIKSELRSQNSLSFAYLFSPKRGRLELIVTFLAVLELMKIGTIAVNLNSDNSVTLHPLDHG